mmetsp:Transcript_11627/g.25160  ORF Transcript_11627/g.25160 Transcript_11627/m.25160 type:complete len:89 (-) Transcript_11627:223-489(-)
MAYESYVAKWGGLWDSVLKKRSRIRSSSAGAVWILLSYWLLKVNGENLPQNELFDKDGNLYDNDDFVKRTLVWMMYDVTKSLLKMQSF